MSKLESQTLIDFRTAHLPAWYAQALLLSQTLPGRMWSMRENVMEESRHHVAVGVCRHREMFEAHFCLFSGPLETGCNSSKGEGRRPYTSAEKRASETGACTMTI